MKIDLGDLNAFVAVARARGFREARARAAAAPPASARRCAGWRRSSASGCSTARRAASCRPKRASGLLERLGPALTEVEAALDVVNGFRDRPAGTLRLNVPVSAARLVLPAIVPPFLAAYPDIRLEVIAEDSFVDVLAAGCDAGIRYDERLEQDMIAVPIGPRVQRFATAASPAYLDRRGRPRASARPARPCLPARPLRQRRDDDAWEFERDGEVVRVDPTGPLIVRIGRAADLAVDAAIAGTGIISLFEDWLRPHFDSGALEPVLEPWWQSFSGPFLYYPGRRLVPAPLRAFIDFIKARGA